MSCQTRGTQVSVDEAGSYPAVKLFVERATAAQPGFRLTEQNVGAVVQICQRLDGMPLALELAAARVRALPVEQLAARLDDRFRLLTGGSRLSVPRHQTLRATIDWSHDSLDDQEKAVFRRLAAFAGGCSLAAAESVVTDDLVVDYEVIDVLTRLVDKSLVQADPAAEEARFRMLETIREYAREYLVESGEAERIQRRHRDWFLALVERAKPDFFRGPPPAEWLIVFDREHDNLNLSLEWSAAEAGGATAGLHLAAGMWRYWEIRGYVAEGRQWMERMLAATDGEVSVLRANALTGAGILAHIQGDYQAAIRYHEESLEQHREVGSRPSVVYALHNLANVAAEHGDLPRARQLYEEASAMAQSLGDEFGATQPKIALADVIARQGDYVEAGRLFDEAAETFSRMGDRWSVALTLDNHAQVAARAGDFAGARELQERSLAISTELGDERSVARTLMHVGDAAALEADRERATTVYRQCLAMRRKLRDLPGIAAATERLAWIMADDAPDKAALLLGSAQALRDRIKTPIAARDRDEYERSKREIEGRLGPATFEAAYRTGRTLDSEAAIRAVFSEEATAETAVGAG